MDRRKFIRNSISTLPIALSPFILSTCTEGKAVAPNGKSVIVIGAGISGLAAAKKLTEKGFKVMILESQNRIGGRISTNRTLGFDFDEGASWIHGPNKNPISVLATDSGAKTFLTDDNNVSVFDINGSQYSDYELTKAEKLFENALDSIKNNGSVNKSFQDVFNAQYPKYANNSLWKYFLSAYIAFDFGELSELSSIDYDDDEAFEGEDLIITNGYDKITNFLAKGLKIKLNEAVVLVNYANSMVKVKTNLSEYEANFVVISVPLGVLKNNIISFSPSLPNSKQQAIKNIKINVVNKFLLVWDLPFWDTNLQYVGFTPASGNKFNYFLNYKKINNTNALVTYAYGNDAKQTEQMTDNEVITEIMNHLKAIYGKNIPSPRTMIRTKWASDKNTFGSYTFASNGTRSTDFNILADDIEQKIFFAGEHTNKDYRGTVHGAYLSGIREADKIIRL